MKGIRATRVAASGLALTLAVALSACGGTRSASAPRTATSVSSTTARAWPAKWCRAQLGMTRQQLRALMGPPTGEYGPNNVPAGVTPQMSWYAYDYGFDAFFDVDDHVKQLAVNDIHMTADERAALGCELIRGT